MKDARKTSPRTPTPPPSARAAALTLHEARRVVRKEAQALRKAYERASTKPDPMIDWERSMVAFYEDAAHAHFVSEALLFSLAGAAAWCRWQTRILLSLRDRDAVELELECYEQDAPPVLAALAHFEASTGRLPSFLHRLHIPISPRR